MFKRKKNSLKGFQPTISSTAKHANSNATNTAANANTHTNAATKNADSATATRTNATNSNNNHNIPIASNDTAAFLSSLNDTDVIEHVRTTIRHAHVFKLPTRKTASIGWRGADWKEKVWHGSVKVVDRNNVTAILLVDEGNSNSSSSSNKNSKANGDAHRLRKGGTIFAVCPMKEGAVERCVDSSRYFVLRIENDTGRHMFIGLAFNERNDAFDFNTALQDAQRERDYEAKASQAVHRQRQRESQLGEDGLGGGMDALSLENLNGGGGGLLPGVAPLKEGERIKVNLGSNYEGIGTGGGSDSGSGTGTLGRKSRPSYGTSTGFVLKPSKKDTPARSSK